MSIEQSTAAPEDPHDDGDHGYLTRWGFAWGPMDVSRCASLKRSNGMYRVLTVAAGGKHIHIYVSPTGRSIRVFDDTWGEWKPVAK